MTKDLYKTIMKRSRLRNIFLTDRTKTNQKNFKLQKDTVRTAECYKKVILQ